MKNLTIVILTLLLMLSVYFQYELPRREREEVKKKMYEEVRIFNETFKKLNKDEEEYKGLLDSLILKKKEMLFSIFHNTALTAEERIDAYQTLSTINYLEKPVNIPIIK